MVVVAVVVVVSMSDVMGRKAKKGSLYIYIYFIIYYFCLPSWVLWLRDNT